MYNSLNLSQWVDLGHFLPGNIRQADLVFRGGGGEGKGAAKNFGSISISGQLRTYPSPNRTVTLTY